MLEHTKSHCLTSLKNRFMISYGNLKSHTETHVSAEHWCVLTELRGGTSQEHTILTFTAVKMSTLISVMKTLQTPVLRLGYKMGLPYASLFIPLTWQHTIILSAIQHLLYACFCLCEIMPVLIGILLYFQSIFRLDVCTCQSQVTQSGIHLCPSLCLKYWL